MLRFLADENFRRTIVVGVLRRNPTADILRVQDVGLRSKDDPSILDWAAAENRVLLTHDRDTIPHFAYERMDRGLTMPGVIVVSDRTPNRRALDDLMLFVECGVDTDCRDLVRYVPLPH